MTHSAILAEDARATYQRMLESKGVLLIQDTTTLDYSDHAATEGLGVLENEATLGFLAHTTLAVGMDGEPLGIVKQLVWARAPEEKGRRAVRDKTPFEEKESYKWVAGLPENPPAPLPDSCTAGQWVTVCDREAHIYPFLDTLQGRNIGFIVRAAQGRSTVLDAGLEAGLEGDNTCAPLFDAVAAQPVMGEAALQLKRRPDREPRMAQIEIRTATFTLKRPRSMPPPRQGNYSEQLCVNVVDILEPGPPAAEKPVHWLLLTSLPVATTEEALQVARNYTLRWMIERFHYILKSGCRIEESQLRHVNNLERLLALYTRVAWRILQMTHLARMAPDLPCTVLFAPDEWQALWLYRNRSMDFPDHPPTLHEVVRWIALLGGFLGRKGDGEPGVKVLWRGWTKLMSFTDYFNAIRPALLKDVGNV